MSNKHQARPEPSGAKEPDQPSEPQVEKGASAPAEADTGLERLRERIVDLEAELARAGKEASALKDQYLRSLADYENFRKRMFREREDLQKYANFGLLGDLVPLLDDFDRAIASSEHSRDYQGLHDGIALIRRQIASVLENKYGLTRFESLDKPFDPHVHEAVASEFGDVEEPMVAMEFLPGYRLHDRVVRSAKVRVRMPSPAAANPAASAASGAGAASESGVSGTGGQGAAADSREN